MKLKNRNAHDYLGRTIIYKNMAWQIAAVTDDAIQVKRYIAGSTPGLLRHDQLALCRLYPTLDEIAASYPRLLRALRETCLLTTTEARSALLGLITNGPFFDGSEAVARIGGAARAVEHAWSRRHNVRRTYHAMRVREREALRRWQPDDTPAAARLIEQAVAETV